MLNGFGIATTNNTAKFSGVPTQIGLNIDVAGITTAAEMAAWVQSVLTSVGFQNVSVTPFGANHYLISLTGNTSDNLTTVARVLQQRLIAAGIPASNARAEFINNPVPTQQPTQQQQQGFHFRTVIVRVTGNPYVLTSGYLNAGSLLRDVLGRANWIITALTANPSLLGQSVYTITFSVGSQYSDTQIVQQLYSDLAPYFDSPRIEIVSTSVVYSDPNAGANASNSGNDNGNGDESFSLDNWLSKFGSNLGFSAGGALVGGLAVAGIFAYFILKK